MSLNRVTLIGRLSKALELQYTPHQQVPFVVFNLVVNRLGAKPDPDSGKVPVDVIRCVVWHKSAQAMCQYLTKGSLICLDGRLKVERFTSYDAAGTALQRTAVEVHSDQVHFLESQTTLRHRLKS
jgi:single-strand DNA-binding protein